MSPHLPITPEEIANQAIEAAGAGAAILHLHARDPRDGRPTPDPAVFRQFLPRIHAECDAVVNITTGHHYGRRTHDVTGTAVMVNAEPGAAVSSIRSRARLALLMWLADRSFWESI
jgi:uncharacterized protein (DUF849 family)